jgi:chromosome partitioning protein
VIVAFLKHKGGVGKTTLALHVAGAWAAQDKRIVVLDTDSQGSALDWSEQRAKEGLMRRFNVLELTRNIVHLEAPQIARDVHHVVIDGSSDSAALMRSAMLAADLTLVPAQPSPFDGWASRETLRAPSGGAALPCPSHCAVRLQPLRCPHAHSERDHRGTGNT